MEKKFSIPVSMKVNQEQFNYLKEELIKLGYEVTLETLVTDYPGSPNILITQYTHNNNFTNTFSYRDSNYIIQEYNPELFLALASMTSNEEFFVGECIIRVKDEHGILNVGDLGVIINVIERGSDFAVTVQNDKKGYMHSTNNIRKATQEEIINHFNKVNMKKLIGYNLKKDCAQFEQASFAIINSHSVEGNTKFVNKNGVDFTEDSKYCAWLKEANVLDLWFEPVYESIKKDVQVSVKASKQLVFTISKDHEGYVEENQENKKVSIQSLADMVNYGFGLHGYSAYKIKPVTFDMGCVKNICTSGIEKVIEAYDEFWGTSHSHLELPF